MSIFWRSVSFIKNKWWLILLIVAFLGFGAFKIFGSADQTKKPTTYTVKRQTLKETLSFSGYVDALEKATLRFQTSGYLNWMGVKEGDSVKKFQVLASLDQADLQKNLQKYLNTYTKSRNTFEQNKDDYNNNFVTDDLKRVAQGYQMDLNNAVLDVELKSLAMKYANLWTPIDGVVTRVETKNAGVNVTPTQAEIDVVNPQTLYFSATADQSDVVKLMVGQQGEITLDAFDTKPLTASISAIGFTPKEGETGTVYEVKLSLPLISNHLLLRLGMTGDVEFVVKQVPDALSVPRNYLKTENGRKYVLLKDGQKVFPELGDEFDNEVEIKNGLGDGDTIMM